MGKDLVEYEWAVFSDRALADAAGTAPDRESAENGAAYRLHQYGVGFRYEIYRVQRRVVAAQQWQELPKAE